MLPNTFSDVAYRDFRDARCRRKLFIVAVLLLGTGTQAIAQGVEKPDTALLRTLVGDASSAAAAQPQLGDERVAAIVTAQAQSGDIAGARATAKRLASSWYPFARLAIVQRDRGDLPGAIETTKLASTAMDRAQALGYLASAFTYAHRYEEGLAIARTIEWPKQRVEELKLAAEQMRIASRDSLERVRALLREALGVARSDTSFWGSYFTVELAYEQAAAADLDGAFRVLHDTLDLETRAERMGRILAELQRAPIPRARELSDSLYRAALRVADGIPDEKRRRVMQARVRWLYGVYGGPAQTRVLEAESRTPEERLDALEARVKARGDSSEPLVALVELERLGEYHRAARAITGRIADDGELWFGQRSAVRSAAEALARRAIADAERVSARYADSTRLQLVDMLARLHLPFAAEQLGSFRDSATAVAARVAVANAWLHESADSALAILRPVPPSASRDAVLHGALPTLLMHGELDRAIAIAHTIRSEKLRANALMTIAAFDRGEDGASRRALYEEALPALDPREPALDGVQLIGAIRFLGIERMRQWARTQPTPERRAAATVALLEVEASVR